VRVYVDPQTGRRTTQPSPDVRRSANAAAANNPAFNQSSEGLSERPLAGGGTIVDLEGRFQSSVEVRIGADGKRQIVCDDATHAGMNPHRHDAVAAQSTREER
jgi:hypothetical protein